MATDTHPEVARAQLDLLRRAGCGQRAGLARSLSRTVIDLARRELANRMPGATTEQIDLAWVEHSYGADLAGRLRAFLSRRGRGG